MDKLEQRCRAADVLTLRFVQTEDKQKQQRYLRAIARLYRKGGLLLIGPHKKRPAER